MENNIEDVNLQNDEEVVTPKENEPKELGLPEDPVEVEPKDEDNSDTEELKQRNQELYEQLKKAKGFVRDKEGKWVKKEQAKPVIKEESAGMAGVTTEELYSLVRANVPDEDTREVKLYARSHGITITEALKLPEVKALLKVKEEYRKTAEASNTNFSRRMPKKLSDEQVIADLEAGKIPDDPEEAAKIWNKKKMMGRKN